MAIDKSEDDLSVEAGQLNVTGDHLVRLASMSHESQPKQFSYNTL
jgi:hypothetical protein